MSMDGWLDGWMNGSVAEWKLIDGWMDSRTDRLMDYIIRVAMLMFIFFYMDVN